MRILKLNIENIGPYVGEHKFVLDKRGLVMVFGDNQDEFRMNSNGAGKSWLFDALDWCLFGKVPRGDHADSVISDNHNFAKVTVSLLGDKDENIVVSRDRKLKAKTNLYLSVNGDDKTTLDINATQVKIEDVLGLDRNIFHSTVLFSQTDLVHYADSTDKQRIDILTQILGLEEIDSLLENTKSEVSALNDRQENVSRELRFVEEEIQNINILPFDFNIKEFEDNRCKQVSQFKAMISNKKEEHASSFLSVDTNSIRSEINELTSKLKPKVYCGASTIDERKSLSYKLGADISILVSGLNSLLSEQADIKKKLAVGGVFTCRECNQVVSEDHMKLELGKVETHIVANRSELDNVSNEKSLVDAEIAFLEEESREELNKIEKHNLEIQTRIVGLRANLANADKEILRVKALEREINELASLLKTKEEEVNPWVQQKDRAIGKHTELVCKRVSLHEQLNSIAQLKSYYEFWLKAFGPKGLKSYVLDSKINLLNDYINKWVKLLTGGTIWVQFGSTKTTRSNKVVNSPDIKICRWNSDGTITERNYRSWSGGEKQRISLAIDFGLSMLISSRAKYNYDLIILDEVFKHLDSGGKEAVVELLMELARDKSSVFVIDHDTEFQSMFENRVVIEKKNGVSHIVEESNEQQKQNETKSEVLRAGTTRKRFPVRQPVSV